MHLFCLKILSSHLPLLGVLDSDELTFINKGFETAELPLPPDTCQRDAFHPGSHKFDLFFNRRMAYFEPP